MEINNYTKKIIRYFPLCFLILLAIYMSVKFIFIFFFRAAFEPQFMFDLTPYYVLSGVNNLHLLVLSLIVVFFDAYLHFNISKRNLVFSFIPTGIMLAGLGLRITVWEMVDSSVLSYLVFGCLLIIALIDQKHILLLQDVGDFVKKEPVIGKSTLEKPIVTAVESPPAQIPVVGKPIRIEGIDEILALHKQTLIDLRAVLKDDIQRAQNIMEDLEKRRKNLIDEEKLFRNRFISHLNDNIQVKPTTSDDELPVDIKTDEDNGKQPTMLDDFLGSAAVVKRGVLKQVNQPFIELTGYDSDTLLEKNLIDFIAPEGLPGIEEYFSNKERDKVIYSYDTVFLTKDKRKIPVKIFVKPMIYNKKKVDMILIRNI